MVPAVEKGDQEAQHTTRTLSQSERGGRETGRKRDGERERGRESE